MTTALAPIRTLPPAVADAIAAGEVVERPASVLKELCENALDAGATRIDVVIEGGGIVRSRVVDDGWGIGAGELPLATARYATSKISAAADLATVRTLGFRGEALAAIAAVADLTIISRPRDAPDGARLRLRAARELERGAAGCAPGTAVEVRDLFFATPARLRFLRSARTETAAAVRAVADLALARPDVAFHVVAESRTALRTPGGTLGDALRGVIGGTATAALVGIDAAPGDIAISGWISNPGAHRGARDQLLLVVNGRPVHNRMLGVAVEEAYRGRLPSGRHPYGVVVLALAPEMVDVNVHPAKREVRFREEGRVFAAVQRACWAALQAVPAAAASLDWRPVGEGRAGLTLRDATAPAAWLATGGQSTATAAGEARAVGSPSVDEVGLEALTAGSSGPEAVTGVAALAPLRALGQAGSRWLAAESPQGIVVIDPHAAHERVLYAELLAGWARADAGRASVASQMLLLPVVVECDPAAVSCLEENADEARRLGFELEAFGPGLVRCSAVPAVCAGADVARLVADVVGELAADVTTAPADERRHRLAALLACHSAVRFGDALGAVEQERLLQRLAATTASTTCPHGRPTVLVLDDAALRRAFRRPAE